MFQSSGLCNFGFHCPNSSLTEKILSLALAFSSSRLAPPIQQSNLNSSIVSNKVYVCNQLRLGNFPLGSVRLLCLIVSSTFLTTNVAPTSFTNLSRKSNASGKL